MEVKGIRGLLAHVRMMGMKAQGDVYLIVLSSIRGI